MEKKTDLESSEFRQHVKDCLKNDQIPFSAKNILLLAYPKTKTISIKNAMSINTTTLQHLLLRVVTGTCTDSDIDNTFTLLQIIGKQGEFFECFNNEIVNEIPYEIWGHVSTFLAFDSWISLFNVSTTCRTGLSPLFGRMVTGLMLEIVAERSNRCARPDFSINENYVSFKNSKHYKLLVAIPFHFIFDILKTLYKLNNAHSQLLATLEIFQKRIQTKKSYVSKSTFVAALNNIHYGYNRYTPLIVNNKIDLRTVIQRKLLISRYLASGCLSSIKNVCLFKEMELVIDCKKQSHFDQLLIIWNTETHKQSVTKIIYNILNENDRDCTHLLIGATLFPKVTNIDIKFFTKKNKNKKSLQQPPFNVFQSSGTENSNLNSNNVKYLSLEYMTIETSQFFDLINFFPTLTELIVKNVDIMDNIQNTNKIFRIPNALKSLEFSGSVTASFVNVLQSMRFGNMTNVKFYLRASLMNENTNLNNIKNKLENVFQNAKNLDIRIANK